MATLTIRKVPDALHRALRVRAARAGRSLEAEVRDILARAEPAGSAEGAHEDEDPVSAVQKRIAAHYAMSRKRKPKSTVDDFIRERRREAKREL